MEWKYFSTLLAKDKTDGYYLINITEIFPAPKAQSECFVES